MSYKNQSGFSLIELMVALLLSAFLVAGSLQIFLLIKKVWMNQEGIARLQENTQALSIELGSAIRNAGNIGCTNIQDISVLTLHNSLHGNLKLQYKSPISILEPLQIQSYSEIYSKIKAKLKPNTPVLSIIRAKKFTELSRPIEGSIDEIFVKGKFFYKKGQMVIIADCSSADIIKVAKDSRYLSTQNVTIIPLSLKDKPVILSKKYRKNSEVGKLEHSFYFIGDTSRINGDSQPIFGLYKTVSYGRTMELVEGVDDWQLDILNDTNDPRNISVLVEAQLNSIEPATMKSDDRLMYQSFSQVWRIRSIN